MWEDILIERIYKRVCELNLNISSSAHMANMKTGKLTGSSQQFSKTLHPGW